MVRLPSPRRTAPLLFALLLFHTNSSLAAWPHDPLVNVPLCTSSGDQTILRSVPDGAGGAIVTWKDHRGADLDIYVQRVLSSGAVDPAWPADGLALCTAAGDQDFPRIVSDGAGGAIVTWFDLRDGVSMHIYAQHALASGAVDPAWPVNGRALCLAALGYGGQDFPRITTDGAGGAIVAWQDSRFGGIGYVYAQRVRSNGVVDPAWPTDGAWVPTDVYANAAPSLVADGAGGAIVLWQTLGASTNQDVRAHHLLANGTPDPSWPVNGRVLCAVVGDQFAPEGVGDGAGGAIVVWDDRRGGTNTDDVYVQRVLSTGALAPGWPADGRALSAAANIQNYPSICSDGSGGALVAWQDYRSGTAYGIYAGHISSGGTVDPAWPADGLALCTAVQHSFVLQPVIALDGVGGAIVAWADSRVSAASSDIYAHRVRISGSVDPAWPVDGRAVCTAAGSQFHAEIVPDGHAGAVVAWQDRRGGSNYDIYAQQVSLDGQLGSSPALVAVPPVVITALAHSLTPPDPPFSPNYTIMDAISIPGSGYSSSGFATALATGDTVRIRFEAPAGKRFVVHHTPGMASEMFFFNTYWQAANDQASHVDPHTVVFENLSGPAPAESYSFVGVGDGGHVILCQKQYSVAADFEFTAMEIRILASHAFSVGSQAFGAVQSSSQPSWGVTAEVPTAAGGLAMEILDRPVVAVSPGPAADRSADGFSLALITGNPTSGPIGAEFAVGREAHVRLGLYDVQGREVALLRVGLHSPGRYQAKWDGIGRTGAAPAGVYILRYSAAGHAFSRRVVVAR